MTTYLNYCHFESVHNNTNKPNIFFASTVHNSMHMMLKQIEFEEMKRNNFFGQNPILQQRSKEFFWNVCNVYCSIIGTSHKHMHSLNITGTYKSHSWVEARWNRHNTPQEAINNPFFFSCFVLLAYTMLTPVSCVEECIHTPDWKCAKIWSYFKASS